MDFVTSLLQGYLATVCISRTQAEDEAEKEQCHSCRA